MWYRVIISRPQGPQSVFVQAFRAVSEEWFRERDREVLCTYINIYVLISQANKLSIVGTQVEYYVHIFFPSKRHSALRGANTEANKNGDHWRHCQPAGKWQLPRSCHDVLLCRKQKSLWINKRLPMTDDSFSIGAQNFKPLRSRTEPVTVQIPSMLCSKMILVEQSWYSLVSCKPSRRDMHLKINLSILFAWDVSEMKRQKQPLDVHPVSVQCSFWNTTVERVWMQDTTLHCRQKKLSA